MHSELGPLNLILAEEADDYEEADYDEEEEADYDEEEADDGKGICNTCLHPVPGRIKLGRQKSM